MLSSQAALYTKLCRGVLSFRSAAAAPGESPPPSAVLPPSAKLVELNPEVYTAWNLRRGSLLALAEGEGAAAGGGAEATPPGGSGAPSLSGLFEVMRGSGMPLRPPRQPGRFGAKSLGGPFPRPTQGPLRPFPTPG